MKDFFLKGVKLSEDEKLVVETVQDLCRKDIGPLAAEVDRDERFPWENIEKTYSSIGATQDKVAPMELVSFYTP